MNRMPSFLIATLICAAPIPGAAAEQAEPLQATEQVRLHAQAFTQAGLGSEESLQLAASLEKARVPQSVTLRLAETLRACLEEKLPGTPLMDKLREGLAKGVPAEELLRAGPVALVHTLDSLARDSFHPEDSRHPLAALAGQKVADR